MENAAGLWRRSKMSKIVFKRLSGCRESAKLQNWEKVYKISMNEFLNNSIDVI